MKEEIQNLLEGFNPISLGEMDSVALLKRTDTKFILPANKLNMLLVGLENNYKVLTIDGHNIMTYVSAYFDTPSFSFYTDHHNGKLNRNKVRIRHYVESNIYFLEVKRKNGRGVTRKSRQPIAAFEEVLSPESAHFIHSVIGKELQLKPSLTNSFNRITLVNLEAKERVTIDLSLAFSSNEKSKNLEDLVIVELKQERFDRNAMIVRKLRTLGYHPFSVSKYCIGLASLEHELKHNAFKPKFQKIKKLIAA